MTESEDLSSWRLKRRYVRQLRWLWRHQSWRNNQEWWNWPATRDTRAQEYGRRLSRATDSHRLLVDRGWPMTVK